MRALIRYRLSFKKHLSYSKVLFEIIKTTTMRREMAISLVKDWRNKICIHPHTEEEYYMGRSTGNIVCTICGKTISKKFNYKVTIKKIFKIKF